MAIEFWLILGMITLLCYMWQEFFIFCLGVITFIAVWAAFMYMTVGVTMLLGYLFGWPFEIFMLVMLGEIASAMCFALYMESRRNRKGKDDSNGDTV